MTHLTQVRLQELVLASWDLDEQAVDLLPILSACSASLESLMLDIYGVYERESSDPAGGISRDILPARLDALRNLRIVNSIRGLPRTVRIECPSLKEMEIRQSRVDPWTIPQWIRTNLHELVLDVCPIAPMPNVGGSIRPSSLTINVVQTSMTRPLDIIEWIGKCIDCLQFADHLLELSINIDLQGWGGQDYPNAAHYEALYRIIEPLHKHGALRKVAINVGDVGDPLDLGEADFEEAAVFERVFAPLLEDIIAIGGVRRITCKYGWMNVLMSYEVTL
ncbi:hypothetical protein EYR40_002158 [Pleurotus pulmonarius]|nr:hypothetical protein EYR40_002158 [Pleurotus pulmonarius]KAF4607661.1 hypothetical protein EYR38_001734 [Pleurotus pulmonarius]